MFRLADLLEKRSEEFHRAEVLDQGKTLDNAKTHGDEFSGEANTIRLLVSQALSTLDQASSDNGK